LGKGKTTCLPIPNPVAANLVLYRRLTSYEGITIGIPQDIVAFTSLRIPYIELFLIRQSLFSLQGREHMT
jgi:hypothetical protein